MLEKFKVFALLVVAAALLTIATRPLATQNLGGSYADSRFTSATNTVVTLSNASAVVLAKDSSRIYAIITNDDASINVFLALGGTATADSGIKLTPGSSYVINTNNLYVGDVSAIAASATPKLLITYK